MSKVETRFRSLMLISFVMVFIKIIIGALLIFYLDFSVKVTAVIIGTVVLLQGMFYFIRYLYDGLGKKVFAVDLVVAVVDIVLGAFMIFYDFASLNHIGIVFGLHLIGAACENGYYAIKLRSHNDSSYPLIIVISLLLVIMGVFVIFNPLKSFVLATKMVGLFMLCEGVFGGMVCKLFFDKTKVVLSMF